MGINDAERGTCATIFMLPAIGMVYEDLLKYGFLNAYIEDVSYEIPHGKSIFLLFKPDDFDTLQDFIEKLRKVRLITDDYDYYGGYVVTVHPIPTKWMKDYSLFRQGRYSQFSEAYKKLFPEFVDINVDGRVSREVSLQTHIFKRSQVIRSYWEHKLKQALPEDAEMWSKPDVYGFETLNIQKI